MVGLFGCIVVLPLKQSFCRRPKTWTRLTIGGFARVFLSFFHFIGTVIQLLHRATFLFFDKACICIKFMAPCSFRCQFWVRLLMDSHLLLGLCKHCRVCVAWRSKIVDVYTTSRGHNSSPYIALSYFFPRWRSMESCSFCKIFVFLFSSKKLVKMKIIYKNQDFYCKIKWRIW